jgi:Glycine-rich domain-containing protein-like
LPADLLEFLNDFKSLSETTRTVLAKGQEGPSKGLEFRWNNARPYLEMRGEEALIRAYLNGSAGSGVGSAVSQVAQPLRTTFLTGAVLRQSQFVDKMGYYLWIRSPSLVRTLERARVRYEQFFELLSLHPGELIVPTLDIDLVWHTHQCSSPSAYHAYSMMTTGDRFINHNDDLPKTKLGNGLQRTKELYQIRFAQAYARCLCWDCEALLTASENIGQRDVSKMAAEVKLVVSYHRAVEINRRKGRMLPVRR